jgi:Tol biopolymer transport system component
MWKAASVTIFLALTPAGAGGAVGEGPLIAFSDTRVDFEVVLMRADGTELGRLGSGLENERDPSLSPDGRWVAFESDGVVVVRTDGSGRRRLGPADSSAVDPAWSPDGRRIAWASSREGNYELYAAAPDGSEVERLTTDPDPDLAPAWSSDSRRLVFSRGDDIYELRLDRGTPPRAVVSSHLGALRSPALSPDGTTIALEVASASGVVHLARPQSGRAVEARPHVVGSEPAWSADGRILFLRNGTLWSIRPNGTEIGPVMELRSGQPAGWRVSGWSQADGVVAFGWDEGSRPQLYAVRPDGSDLHRLFEPAAVAPAFAPGGHRLAFFAAGRPPRLVVAAVAARRLIRVSLRPDPSRPSWSPDGRLLAFETRDGVFTVRATGGRPSRLRGTTRRDRQPAWSPDGRSVAFTRRSRRRPSVYVVDLRSARVRRLRGNAESPSWSPDGGRIAFTSRASGPNVDVWAMRRDGSRPRRLTRHPGLDLAPEWSPDGRRIAFVSDRGIHLTPSLARFRVFVMRTDGPERSARPVASIFGRAGPLSWRSRP